MGKISVCGDILETCCHLKIVVFSIPEKEVILWIYNLDRSEPIRVL